ncbi:MAG TPA: DNA repair protein RadC [Bacillota bacterium]|nr:DNA repair protein RadC [Clostridiaceae bacterium]HNR03752.1 DNA repair protein RadC [Bacillota bacterium]HNT02369.1 DNA repair protein RadC [Bacillota bacterium]HNU81091.1 DNA repair protein RadC [Bacillota bacterium]HPA54609.1 DNA repair protein RadC [Bacillota bacterium]
MQRGHATIKNLPEEERPRERLARHGASVLSNAELLAILLRTGTREESAISLAHRILVQEQGLRYLADSNVEQLSAINGIGKAKAAQIKAAIELGKRLAAFEPGADKPLKCPQDVAGLLMEEMRYLKKEHMKLVLLNVKCNLISVEEISVGSLNASIVHPREVFNPAIRKSSASIIMVHNHPSGDPAPSSEDISITARIAEAGKLIGIELVDHIIIGDGKYVSMKEKGLF